MKKYLLLGMVFISACSANGAKYSEDTKGNLILYREDRTRHSATTYDIQIADKSCSLKNGGFFATTIDKEALVSVSWSGGFGTSTITAKPNTYIKIAPRDTNALLGGLGLAGGAAAGIIEGSDGPFELIPVTEEYAKRYLAGLNQDCTTN